MKILIVTHYFIPHIGGIEIVAYNQARELVKKGHTVTIVTSKLSGDDSVRTTDGIKVVRIPAWNYPERKFDIPFPIFSIKLLPALYGLIKQQDVIHAHGALYMGSFLSALFCKFLKKPFIVTEHVGIVHYKKNVFNIIQKLSFLTLGRFTLNNCKQVFVLNEQVKKYISGLTTSPVNIIQNGVDTDLFHPVTKTEQRILKKKYHLPVTKKLVLFVGRFVEKKGLGLMLKSRSARYHLVFAGSGNFPETADKNGIHVFYNLSQKQLAGLYQACDLFILPSKCEGFPLSIQEAMATGLPVITSGNPLYNKIFNTKFIKLIRPDHTQIQHNILEVLSDRMLTNKMKMYSRDFAVNYFKWETYSNTLLNYYRS